MYRQKVVAHHQQVAFSYYLKTVLVRVAVHGERERRLAHDEEVVAAWAGEHRAGFASLKRARRSVRESVYAALADDTRTRARVCNGVSPYRGTHFERAAALGVSDSEIREESAVRRQLTLRRTSHLSRTETRQLRRRRRRWYRRPRTHRSHARPRKAGASFIGRLERRVWLPAALRVEYMEVAGHFTLVHLLDRVLQ